MSRAISEMVPIAKCVPAPLLFVNPGQPWYRWNRHSTLSKNMTLFLL